MTRDFLKMRFLGLMTLVADEAKDNGDFVIVPKPLVDLLYELAEELDAEDDPAAHLQMPSARQQELGERRRAKLGNHPIRWKE